MTESFLSSLPEHERATFVEGVFDLARTGRTSELKEMIASGVPASLTNARNDSLLIVAAYAQQAAVVQVLLDAGAPLDHVNNMGQTAVSCAVFRNDRAILDLLVNAGADVRAGAHSGLAIAQQFGLTNMIEALEGR